MNQPIIEIDNLSKKYTISRAQSYKTLRESIIDGAKKPFQLFSAGRKIKKEEFWALKNIQFSVNRGERIGIIGRNGAGKTTLLKILSQITYPTTGEIKLRGRVASLLEVGTGFHMELTGRENIFLNGAILGMKRNEIKEKFDEIVAFSGVEKFLDTPVKRYSSGMHVRLAFAVAAHLEPEILLVDEVLAVGDVEFQKKCLGKMKDVARSGRTIIFVSHNMAAVKNLCQKCILLKDGQIDDIGDTDVIIDKYLKIVDTTATTPINERKDRKGDGKLKITKIYFEDSQENIISHFSSGQDIKIIAEYISAETKPLNNVSIAFGFDNKNGSRIFLLWNELTGDYFTKIPERGKFVCTIPKLPLAEGNYYFTVAARVNGIISDWVINAAKIGVEGSNYYGSGKKQPPSQGDILVEHSWNIIE